MTNNDHQTVSTKVLRTLNLNNWFTQLLLFGVLALLLIYHLVYKRKSGKRGTQKFDNSGQDANHLSQAIPDRFTSLEQVTEALRQSGVESSNLILGIDYTASNEYQGKKSFQGRCLHDIKPDLLNPYQRVISIIGRTLSQLDEDGFIPAFGFGDAHTKDVSVFPLTPDQLSQPSQYFRCNNGVYCNGFEQVLQVYNAITPHVKLSGPTNFAPMIRKAIEIVMQRNRPEYHILVLIADGQVVNEAETEQALVEASSYPLSIIMVGVGDGPWDTMETYDDELPQRRFDNFQFVHYEKVMQSARASPTQQDVNFALAALMEIPDQFKAIRALRLLSGSTLSAPSAPSSSSSSFMPSAPPPPVVDNENVLKKYKI